MVILKGLPNQNTLEQSHDHNLKSGAISCFLNLVYTVLALLCSCARHKGCYIQAMASVRKRTSTLPPLEVGAKRKHSVNRVLEECKENLAPAQNSRSKKPRLVEQPGKVDALILKLDLEDVICMRHSSRTCL